MPWETLKPCGERNVTRIIPRVPFLVQWPWFLTDGHFNLLVWVSTSSSSSSPPLSYTSWSISPQLRVLLYTSSTVPVLCPPHLAKRTGFKRNTRSKPHINCCTPIRGVTTTVAVRIPLVDKHCNLQLQSSSKRTMSARAHQDPYVDESFQWIANWSVAYTTPRCGVLPKKAPTTTGNCNKNWLLPDEACLAW